MSTGRYHTRTLLRLSNACHPLMHGHERWKTLRQVADDTHDGPWLMRLDASDTKTATVSVALAMLDEHESGCRRQSVRQPAHEGRKRRQLDSPLTWWPWPVVATALFAFVLVVILVVGCVRKKEEPTQQ
jgi:hypothetical protein